MSEAKESKPLAGRGIVVTRPTHQARRLVELIEAAGGHAIAFPAIEVTDLADLGPFTRLVDQLDEFDLAVFISPNAVERAMRLIRARRELPACLKVAAVGGGSVRALEREGVTAVIAPRGQGDSESLLALGEITGARRVIIFRGAGGRELLGETLRARGATVEYAECYRRSLPAADPAILARGWTSGTLDAFTATSSEGLRNLFELVGAPAHENLRHTPLFVPHPRIAEAARDLGVQRVIVTGPGDDGLVTGLIDYFGARIGGNR